MPRIRIDASPNVLQIDRGENPIMGGLTQGLHSLWEGQNRAAEIDRQGERDRHNEAMQLWERERGTEATRFSHEHTAREEARQAKLDEQALLERGLEHERQRTRDYASDADRAKARALEERRVAAEEKRAGAYSERGGHGALNERDAWKLAEEQAQHESIDEFGKPKAVDPHRVQEIHDHLMEQGAAPAGARDPMGLYPHGDLWDAPAAAPAGAPAAPAAPVEAAAPAAPVGDAGPGLWDEVAGATNVRGSTGPGRVRPITQFMTGQKPPVSQPELAAAVAEDRQLKAAKHATPDRRAAFLQLAGDSAPADEGILSQVLSDDPETVQAALQHQYRGRPEHLKVAVAALRHIHSGARPRPAADAQPVPVQAAPVAVPQDPIWDDPVAAGP